MRTRPPRLVVLAFTLALLGAIPSMAHAKPGKGETKQIAEEAFIYGFPNGHELRRVLRVAEGGGAERIVEAANRAARQVIRTFRMAQP
jgi:hypothetical protein